MPGSGPPPFFFLTGSLKQRHHQQLLRFQHHLVRTLLLLSSCVVIWYRPFTNNDIRVRCPFWDINCTYESVTYLRLQTSLCAHCWNPSLLLVSLYLLTIPLQHLSVTSIESLCKHTKALFAKFLFKFAHETASSSTSSRVKTQCSDSEIVWKTFLQSKLYWFLRWLMLKLNHSTINISLSMINQCRGEQN